MLLLARKRISAHRRGREIAAVEKIFIQAMGRGPAQTSPKDSA